MEETQHINYMARCIELAKKGQECVAPNPMVGAVLVYDDRIIGEGFHQKYGEAHAEVNCIKEALQNFPTLISSSTMYVSLEPCAHFGKTPPCADLIIQHNIPKVVVACRDSFDSVNGKGIKKLQQAGIEVTEGILEKEAIDLNKRFFTFHTQKRPYVILKWAQTADGFISDGKKQRLLITNPVANRLVHQWRSGEAGILIGANTAIADDPLLDNRHWYGQPPVKILIDPALKCPINLQMFYQGERVLIANHKKEGTEGQRVYLKLERENLLTNLMVRLYEEKILSVFIEGGGYTLQSFINTGLWDEARIITNTSLTAGAGVRSPELNNGIKVNEHFYLTDRVEFFTNHNAAI